MKLQKIIVFVYTFISLNTHGVASNQKIDEYLRNQKDFSGAVLVTCNDSVILKKGYGYASYEFDIPNDCATKFPIGSNTKSFAAVAILLLAQKNLLSVQDSLNKYIPGFPDSITIHHLLTHTSGISNYYNHWDAIARCSSLEEMIGVAKTWNLDFKPGTQYSYSNTGYLILAHLVEKIAGCSFETFLKENIFERAEMKNSGSICDGRLVKNKASGHWMQNGNLCATPAVNSPLTLAGNGDLYASLDDMHSWTQALFSGTLLDEKHLNLLLYPHVAMQSSIDRFHAYGWFVDKKLGKRVVEYSGALVGYLSAVIRFIDDKVTIVVLTNREDFDQFTKIVDELPLIMFSE